MTLLHVLADRARSVLAAGLLGLAVAGAGAQDVQPVPPLAGRVIDRTATLSAAQSQALQSKLEALEREAGAQLVVLLVPTAQPEDIAAYAHRVADTWKLGRRDVGDGVLVVVAKNDRQVRIEVAKALEGAIPDLLARRIIAERMAPAFREGDYAGGLNLAVDQLAARIKGEGLPVPDGTPSTAESLGVQDLGVLMLLGIPLIAVMLGALVGRKLGLLGTSGLTGAAAWFFTGSWPIALGAALVGLVIALFAGVARAASGRGSSYRGRGAPVIWDSGSWGGGGWGGSSGGGGFGSGGGGDFGGGGASGDW
jgi:uncharacterized protein